MQKIKDKIQKLKTEILMAKVILSSGPPSAFQPYFDMTDRIRLATLEKTVTKYEALLTPVGNKR